METPSRGIGWKYDLPAPQIEAALDLEVKNLLRPVNDINDNYLELPRSTLKARGYWIIGSILISTVALTGTIQSLYYFPPEPTLTGLKQLSFFMLIYLIIACFITPYIRMDFGFPQDEPIRFNRQRRKVYFYQYRFNFLNPFGKKNWGVIPVAYDWDDLTLEAYRIYAPMGNGGLKEEVKISICKPGTNEIIDRFFFTDDIEEGEQYWAIVRLFMHQGPEALPDLLVSSGNADKIPNPDLRGKAVFRNPFDRLAPKVQWPTDMDLESRTAPNQAEKP